MRFNNLISVMVLTLLAVGCGGGADSGAGSRNFSNKCTLSNPMVSPGTTATLSKSTGRLSVAMTLMMDEAQPVKVLTNFESAGADDWIEGIPFQRNMNQGSNQFTLGYDLNSPSKTVNDRYTKLTVIAELPNKEACVTTLPVNILLNQ
jgi:hypothetical protein